MKAVTWHGKRDVRVDTVPDPTIEEPTDAIVRITSTGICGSDLHLYEVLGPFIDEGDILGHEPMGDRRGGRRRGHAHRAGRPRRDPVQHLLRPLLHVRPRAAVAVRDDPDPRAGHGRLAVRLHEALRPGRRAARPSTCASRRPTTGRSRCPRARRTTASSTSPTSCPPPGRRSSTRTSPTAAPSPCSGSGRSATCARGSPSTRAPRRSSASTSCPSGSRGRARHGIEVLDSPSTTTIGDSLRELTDGRGPDSVIDAVGMEAHGAPIGEAAQKIAGLLPDAIAREADGDGRRRPPERAQRRPSTSSAAAARSRCRASTAACSTRCR